MFNRYWRTYPWGLQVALVMLTIFTLTSFATYLVLALLPHLSGYSFADMTQLGPGSKPGAIRAGIWAQAISHAGAFGAPGLLFALFTHPRMRGYLGLRSPGRLYHWLIVTGLMLGLIPVFLWGESWSMQHLRFGQWADELQAANDNMFNAFLRLNSGADLFLLLSVLALLPAFGEELIFRGILLRLVHRRVNTPLFPVAAASPKALPDAQRSMVFPVIFTALLFAAIHFNPHGFVFIFIAGCVLALIYFLTGSLLCSIWAHFLYNGSQVALMFMSQRHAALRKVVESNEVPLPYVLAGLLAFAACFYLLVKSQTPLPADWSDDFREERERESQESLLP